MAQTLANADAIMKDDYIGPVIEELNNRTYLIDQLERDTDHVDHTGRRAVIPVHKNRNRGRGSTADAGQLPTAGQQQYLDAIVNIRYHYYAIDVSDASIEASSSSDGAFLSTLEAETKGVAVDMRKDINRQAFGTGTGLLGNCGVTAGSTTIVLGNSIDTQYIKIGDVVDIVVQATGSTGTGAVGVTVTGRNVAAGTITVSGSALTTDATYGVYVSGNRNNEMDGLRNITAIGRTLHSIDSTAAGNQFWDANEIQVGTAVATPAVAGESSFEQLGDNIGQSGNGDVEVFLTTRGIRRRLADTYQSQKRFNDSNAVDVHGGYSAIMVNEIPVVADDDCPKQYAFGFNKSSLKWFEQTSPGWLQSQGGDIFQLRQAGAGLAVASWQAWLRWYVALGSVAPNRSGRLRFCTDDLPATNN
jgi:hypothetical protein